MKIHFIDGETAIKMTRFVIALLVLICYDNKHGSTWGLSRSPFKYFVEILISKKKFKREYEY